MSLSLPCRSLVSTAFVAFASTVAFAQAPTVVTSQAALLAGGNASPAPYTNNFTGATNGEFINSVNFSGSGGAFSYTISVPSGGTYVSGAATGEFFGTFTSNRSITITFTSGNVTGIGGRFFDTDIGDVFQSEPVKLDFTLSNATTYSHPAYTPGSTAEYRGFLFNQPGGPTITSMVIAAPVTADIFAGLDDFTVLVATPVPEPTLMLAGAAGLALVVGRVRRRFVPVPAA